MEALERKLLSRLSTQFQAPLRRLSPSPHSLPRRILILHGIPSGECLGEQKHWRKQSSPHSHISLHLIQWIPWRAEALARAVLAELEKELAGRPRPVVFMSFSGGYKACQWKIMEALLSTSAPEAMHRDANAAGAAAEAVAPVPSSSAASPQSALASEREGKVSTSYQHFLSLLRECYAGQVFDSSPVDFTSDLGVRFLSQPPPVTAQPQATFQASATSQQPSTSQPPLTPQCTGSAPASAVATALAAATTPATPAPDAPATSAATAAQQPRTVRHTLVRFEAPQSAPFEAPKKKTAPDAPATSAATAAQQPRTVRHTLVRSAAVVLDWLLLPEFERQRAAQWATLLHCSALAPVLLLCSTDDQLAPIEFIRQYEREAVARGAAVTRVEWRTSEHVGEWGLGMSGG
ncbi:unnamed protein product [Closterium sp. Naga37s-1]|nr:unnamed protein product [Closterium sp. Naga37s-1]